MSARGQFDRGDHAGLDLVRDFRIGLQFGQGSRFRSLNHVRSGGLPVQAPTKYEFAINLKTAKALGLTLPPVLLTAADEVVE